MIFSTWHESTENQDVSNTAEKLYLSARGMHDRSRGRRRSSRNLLVDPETYNQKMLSHYRLSGQSNNVMKGNCQVSFDILVKMTSLTAKFFNNGGANLGFLNISAAKGRLRRELLIKICKETLHEREL